MGLFDGAGSLLQGAMSWFGAEQQNRRQADAAESANAFSAQQFASRYQTTVNDMKAAGLNPMLAYSQGGGAPPSGQQANVPANSGSSAVAGFNAGKLNQAQVDLLKAQEDAASAQAAKTRAETPFVEPLAHADIGVKGASAAASYSQSRLAESQANKIGVEIPKIHNETLNVAQQTEVLRATAGMLREQAEMMRQKSMTEPEIRAQLQATVAKLGQETALLKFDVQAAEDMGNIGRGSKELAPFIQMLMSMIRTARR